MEKLMVNLSEEEILLISRILKRSLSESESSAAKDEMALREDYIESMNNLISKFQKRLNILYESTPSNKQGCGKLFGAYYFKQCGKKDSGLCPECVNLGVSEQ